MSRPAEGRCWLRLVVPRDNTSAPFTAEQLYAALHAGTPPGRATQILLAGVPGDVGIWLRVEAERLDPLAAMVRSTYPDAELESAPPPLPAGRERVALAGARWALAHEAAYPIKTVRAFEHSEPMAMTLGALAEARAGECGALSLVLSPAPASFAHRSAALSRALATGADTGPWWQRALLAPFDLLAAALTSLLTDPAAAAVGTATPPPRPLTDVDLEARLKWVAGKAAQPAFRVTLRTGWAADDPGRARRGHAGLASALGQFAVVGQNSLLPRREPAGAVWSGILSGRPGTEERMVLAIDELAGLVHSPGSDLVVPHLRRTGAAGGPWPRRSPRAGCAWRRAPIAATGHRSASPSSS